MYDQFAKPATYVTRGGGATQGAGQKKHVDSHAKKFAMIENDNDHFGDHRQKVGIEMANKIKNLRNAKEWTQKDLALHAGVKIDVVKDYESGNAEPNAKIIKRFEQVLEGPLR
ncbi:Helix-turn-helix family protein [Trichomonas vaginalis G3]|uniref:Helix-turn-helix family protein n=1 Tax=Trichomonas vaginalis (strain ATCC PRA-98 / G3) TaxID=412133 RepID=A2DR49_TRIV3|nr:endothelial differentiation-related factor 1 multiprotein bridging factor 1 family [Trichomonas vaginalis G3]EAY17148.1 Helix-turn-helix family protein [Trichomonas vaginalis G3]KAI5508864.1 endothelial differentiation-related factor 1 multiprotein bridging factor 1 family [Trichomonas vaginalis G3]|eukprot:XP_001329371.1 Helix-turn-helix family protein [Trichomonas vaginalis G3]